MIRKEHINIMISLEHIPNEIPSITDFIYGMDFEAASGSRTVDYVINREISNLKLEIEDCEQEISDISTRIANGKNVLMNKRHLKVLKSSLRQKRNALNSLL